MSAHPHTPDPACPTPSSRARRRWEDAPLAREMFVISHLMTRCADRLVADLGLTCARWRLLGAVACFEEAPTLSGLCGEALLSIQNVSRMVAAMEEDGLVERFTRTGMGRAVFVRATERGVRVLEAAKARAERFNRAFLEGIETDEIGHIQEKVDRMIDNLERLEGALSAEHERGANNGAASHNGDVRGEKGGGA